MLTYQTAIESQSVKKMRELIDENHSLLSTIQDQRDMLDTLHIEIDTLRELLVSSTHSQK